MTYSRRDFLFTTAGATAMTMLHGHDALGDDGPPEPGPGAAPHRIRSLHLRTAVPIPVMHRFYHETLGLPVESADDRRLVVGAGQTRITFERLGPDQPGRPFYHFAFNIPENKIRAARDWQAARTPLFATPSHMVDPAYPDDVRHFRSWNAHSVFFADPAGNVLEHIARHDLDNGAPGDFTAKDILYASEIAFVVDDVPAFATTLKQTYGLSQYRGGGDEFQATGDERGLLLVFKRGRQIGAGSGREYSADVFETGVSINSDKPGAFAPDGYPYRVDATA